MDTDGTPGYTGGHWECRCTALLGRSKLDYRPDPRRGRWRLADGNRHATRHAAGGAESGGGCVGKFHGFRARSKNSGEILCHKEAFANNNKTLRRELGPATRRCTPSSSSWERFYVYRFTSAQGSQNFSPPFLEESTETALY